MRSTVGGSFLPPRGSTISREVAKRTYRKLIDDIASRCGRAPPTTPASIRPYLNICGAFISHEQVQEESKDLRRRIFLLNICPTTPDLVSLDTAVEKQADEPRVVIDGCKVKR